MSRFKSGMVTEITPLKTKMNNYNDCTQIFC